MTDNAGSSLSGLEIAIVGMSGRFSCAGSVDELWEMLGKGEQALRDATDAELDLAAVAADVRAHPAYVRKRGILGRKLQFDAALFGYSASDAATMDPQFGVFHELAWEALENAGYDSSKYDGLIGVYAGASSPDAWLERVMRSHVTLAEQYSVASLTKGGYLSTRVAHRLDLTGPAMTINTTCSTSLVAIHTACQALLTGDCDMALAGGVSLSLDTQGYLHQENMVLSPDGSCRPFDAAAAGTAAGEGGGVLVLKRLQDALADNDNVLAVIKGTAVNNDGQRKVGFAAPSIEGQARAIRGALERAEVPAASIGYLEAHGTATALGDPIELAALKQAFSGVPAASCVIGSVKSSIGHLSEGAGVAGVIKTVLALRHGTIPPNPYFTAPNPLLEMASSPFHVNRRALPWQRTGGAPRRAGVSSFGIGGTNAHAVLEEAAFEPASGPGRAWQLVCLSAQTPTALAAIERRLAGYAAAHPDAVLADIAYTLHLGRKDLPYRSAIVASDTRDLERRLASAGGAEPAARHKAGKDRPGVCFMFPGQGAQYPGMTRGLYDAEPLFRAAVDECLAIAARHGAPGLKAALYPPAQADAGTLQDTAAVQPLLFIVEYALAALLRHWGCEPRACLGHSVGEYVAACLAGVFALDDAIALVIARGRIMQQLPAGRMLAVPLGEAELLGVLEEVGGALDIAALNSPQRTVVAGDPDAIDALRATLAARGIDTTLLATAHAFHSRHLDPLLQRFERAFEGITLNAPRLPLLSNLSGTWLSDDEAVSPAYWVAQMRGTVRFADCVRELCLDEEWLLVEVGPGTALSSFAMQCGDTARPKRCLSLVSSANGRGRQDDVARLCEGLGGLYLHGAALDWNAFYAGQLRRRLPLPAYPFEGHCHYPPALLQRGPVAGTAAAQVQAQEAAQAEPAGAGTTVETRLLELWRTYLGHAGLAAGDDLFDHGVDSLMSIRVITQIRESFGVDLPLDAIFGLRTVAGQAAEIERLAGAGDAGGKLAVAPRAHRGPMPLSPAQKRMWIIAQLEQEHSAYNVGFHHFMQGLDLAVLQRVIRTVIERHSILRTRYIEVDGEPVQEVRERFEFDIEQADISDMDGEQRDAAAQRLWQEALLRPIDLRDDLMLRVAAVRISEDTHLLMAVQHHICSDNWSLNLLVDEVNLLYEAFLAGRPDPLPPLPLQYADYALSQVEWLAQGVLERQLPYWQRTLDGMPPLHKLPLDLVRPKYQSFRGTRYPSRVDRAVLDGLSQLGLQHGATLFMAMQAAYAAFLSRYSGETDIVVGFPIANRDQRELESLIGFFVNTLVLRSDLSGNPTFVELLGRTRGRLLQAYAHQDMPFETLVEKLRPARDLSYEPLVQVMLVYLDQAQGQGGRGEAYERADSRFEHKEMKLPFSKYDLTLYFSVVDGELVLAWEYAADLFRPDTIERMAANFATFLRALVAAPTQPVHALPLLSPDEDSRLLAFGNSDAATLLPAPVRQQAGADSFNFSLFYFASDDGARAQDKYRLLMDGARFADRAGFEAVWTPERHFDAFGGVYPNPVVTAAVLAGITSRVHLRAGSCVLPLHNPVRVAEDWSVVDNVSGGRIGIGFAAGFAPRDFALAPNHFDGRRAMLPAAVEQVKALWRGDAVTMTDGKGGETAIRIRPRPLTPELPVWVTTIGNEEAFRQAGRNGDNILTHLMGQTLEELTAKVGVYRAERRAAGHPGEGKVTLLVHTFIAERDDMIVAHVKEPFRKYLVDSVGTPQQIEATLNAAGAAGAGQMDVDAITELAFARYRSSKALFGTPEQCLPLVDAIRASGVNEVACLIDFGVAPELVLESLPRLNQLRTMALDSAPAAEPAADAEPVSVHRLFERRAALAPSALAVVEGGMACSFGALDARSNRLARLLATAHGVGPGQNVGLCMENGIDMVAGLLAIMKAGAAWVPVSPGDDATRTAARLEAAQVRLVLAREGDLDSLAAWDGERLLSCGAALPQDDSALADVDPAAAACVLDGFVLDHRSMAALWRGLAATALRDCAAGTRVALAAPPASAAAVRTVLQLLSGHTLVAPVAPVTAAGALAAFLAAARIGVFDSTSSSLEELLADGVPATAILLAGREADSDAIRSVLANTPGCVCYRVYGDAGSGAGAALAALAPPGAAAQVGRPLPHAQVYLLDERGHPVPLGAPGAVHIGGAGVARACLDGERDAHWFVPDPYSTRPGARLYRTGDLGRWASDGTLVLAGRDLDANLRYWAGKLAGAPSLLDLRTDRPRPGLRDGAMAAWEIGLPAAFAAPSATAALVAAFGVLLQRYSAQDDVCLAVGADGHSLPLRLAADAAAPFSALALQVAADMRASRLRAEYDPDALADLLQIARGAGHAPLCQVLFAVDGVPPDLDRYELACVLRRANGRLHGRLHYRTDLFDAATAGRIARHYEQLLAALAAAPDAAAHTLPMLAPQEHDLIVKQWNDTGAPLRPESGIHRLFEAQAARTPSATALVCGADELSYAELNARANRLAHALRARGVGRDVLVGLCIDRNVHLVVAMLAVLKSGGAYVPLDPGYPRHRLALMLEDAAPPVVLTQRHLLAVLPALPGGCLCVDDDAAETAPMPSTDPEPVSGPADLAYVIYTSGSTGRPKGVMIEHRNALNFIDWSLREFAAAELARTVLSTSINFDLSVFELYVPLAAGATVVLLPNALALDGGEDATLLNTVPSALVALLDAGRLPPSLLLVNSGGEALPQALTERLLGETGLPCVRNLYGPTETTTYSTQVRIERGMPFPDHIGRPIANTQVHILDRHGFALPIGVPGEIHIGGAGVTRGYLNSPRLTAERFVADPFNPGGRLYRTGDLGLYLADGNIRYLGRTDHQVKLRGFRIELGEIEATLLEEPVLAAAALLLLDDRLVAYVVGRDGPPDVDALRSALARKLPEHMVPALFVVLDSLPLTPNGKTNRAALPAPARPAATPYVPPRNETEAALAAILGEVLKSEPVGMDDNFFDLGGHSLMAVQLMGRVRQRFGVNLPLREVFEARTVARLAEIIGLLVAVQALPDAADALEVIEF